MKWKDILLVVLLIGAVVGTYLGIRAKEQIRRGVEAADSIKAADSVRYTRTLRESQVRGDSIRFWEDSATRAARAGRVVDTLIRGARSTLPTATHADSFKTYIKLADTLYPRYIMTLQKRHIADSNRILILTVDRDKWKLDADSAHRDIERLRKNTHVVADAAKRTVNLGILTVPIDVAIGFGSAVVGFAGGYAAGSSNSHKD